jgi:uncharacterized cupin superfamily protein
MASASNDRFSVLREGVGVKAPCRVATTANITLSGEQTIDGVAVVSGDRVLVKNQTDTTQNGIYNCSTGNWTRTLDFDNSDEIAQGTMIIVANGTTQNDSFWMIATASPAIGSALTFSQITDPIAAVDVIESARDDAIDEVEAAANEAGAAQVAVVNAAGVANAVIVAQARSAAIYASTADALSNGVASFTSIVGGSGGTNGSFDVAFSGGGGTGAAARFTVASGALVSITLLNKGRGYTSAPTLAFTASSGLTGASATAVIGQNQPAGTLFAVSPTNGGIFDVYENVSGTATLRGSAPSISLADTAATDKGISTGFLDADSRVLMAFSPAGRLQDSEVFARDVVEQAGAIAPYFVLPAPHGFTISQKNFNIAYMMGQSLGAGYWSLANGTGATSILTTTQPYNNKMLAKIWTPTAGAGSFSAAIEQIQSTHYGETGMAASVNQTRFMRDGFVPPWASWTQDWIVGSNAVVSTALTGIVQGTTPYNNAIAAVTQMRALAGTSCALRDVQLEHGESDMLAGTSQATYLAGIQTLLDNIQTDFSAITGQTDTIFLLMSQIATQSIYSTSSDLVPTTALAMLEAHENNTDMFLIGPKYQYQYSRNDKGVSRDGIHLSNHGYRHHGCKVGQVRHHLYNLKRRWEPLRPSKLTQISRDTLEIEFIVLCPPLVFDTKTVSNPGDMGFVVYNSGGTEQSIDRVWIAGPNKVRIKTVSALPSNWEVSYAYKVYNRTCGSHRFSGSRGNLRDSDNTPSLYNDAQGKPYPMWNWCVLFRKTET